MTYDGADETRIFAEYERRTNKIPADTYSWSKPWNLQMHEHVSRCCIRLLHRAGLFPLAGRSVLDIGCGDGTWLLEFTQWGAEADGLCGIDLRADRIERARRCLPRADLRAGSASRIPWPDASFDLVSQFTVFTSILDPDLKREIADEMRRVLKPAGAILWFDFRVDNPANSQVAGVPASEVHALFPNCKVELASVVLAPPISRRITGRSWLMAELLHALPFLRTHYVGLIRKHP